MSIDTTNFTIRPFEHTDADYAAAVELFNQTWPNQPSTVEIWKRHDNNRNPKHLKRRYIGEIENENTKKIVAIGFIRGQVSSKKTGKYSIGLYIDKEFEGQGLDEPLYTHLVTSLADIKPSKLEIGSLEDNAQRIELLQQNGFKQTMRNSCSELDLASFDFSSFARYSEKAAASGIAIVDLQELQARDSNWMRKLYDLQMVITKEIPSTDEFTPPGLEKYAKRFERVNFRADAWFVAVDGENYVGMSSMHKILKDVITVGITGVLPSHRHRGIGTALKLKSIAFAKAYGANTMETMNEENNPIYALNMKLGFKPIPAWLVFEKVL